MAKPAEVRLKAGWLEDDVRRAQSRLQEWSERSLHMPELSAAGRSQETGPTNRGQERESHAIEQAEDTDQ